MQHMIDFERFDLVNPETGERLSPGQIKMIQTRYGWVVGCIGSKEPAIIRVRIDYVNKIDITELNK